MGARHVVLLVGHGAAARDTPRAWISRLKQLEGERRARGAPITEEERELDARVRAFPRSADNDPYREGALALAARLRARLDPTTDLVVAFNEFCAPSLEDAALEAVANGARRITIVPTMFTPGGVHSEVEIPEAIAGLRDRHPDIAFVYAWPFDLDAVADLVATRVRASIA